MDISPPEGVTVDPGLASLTLLLRFHGIAVNGDQLCHQLGTNTIGITEMLRVAKQFSLRARSRVTTWDRLATTPLPAIAQFRDGGFAYVAKADAEKILLQLPSTPRPVLMKKEQFEAVGNGHLVLITNRDLRSLTGPFYIGWLLKAIHEHKRPLGGALIAPFFP